MIHTKQSKQAHYIDLNKLRLFGQRLGYFLWRYNTTRALVASLLRFLGHTHTHTHTQLTYTHPIRLPWKSDQPVAETTKDTKHSRLKGRNSIFSRGFEAAILASQMPQTYALDRKVTGISNAKIDKLILSKLVYSVTLLTCIPKPTRSDLGEDMGCFYRGFLCCLHFNYRQIQKS